MSKLVPVATPRHLREGWRFSVDIPGFDRALWTAVVPPRITFDTVEFNPANSHTPQQRLPGRMHYGYAYFTKAIEHRVPNPAVEWLAQHEAAAKGWSSADSDNLRRDVTVTFHDRMAKPVDGWRLQGARIRRLIPHPLDASKSDLALETLVLVFDTFQFIDTE